MRNLLLLLCLWSVCYSRAYAQGGVSLVSSVTQNVQQTPGTSLNANSPSKGHYADQYCSTSGVLDQTCLGNAIKAAGNNSTIILSPGTYNFSSKLIVSNLVGVEIVGSGDSTVIKSNGTAFECDNCVGGGISNINFSSSVKPRIISCRLNLSARNMSCDGLPTHDPAEIITLDPWNQGFGHIPTGTDSQLLGNNRLLSSSQTAENFDSGVFYYKPSNVKIERLTGTYNHIVLMDSIGSIITYNRITGGNGAADTKRSMTPGDRCGGICFWFSKNQPPGWFSNKENIVDNNVVTFSASEGIALNNTTNTVVSNNIVSYGGESGIFTGQGLSGSVATPTGTVTSGSTTIKGLSSTASLAAGQPIVGLYIPENTKIVSVGSDSIVVSNAATATNSELLHVYSDPGISYFATQCTITGNIVHNMDFDGIDVGSDYPHTNRVPIYLTLVGNTSCNNFGTGIFGDGQYATISGNTACNNESYGIALDNANSTITGNTAVDNNQQKASINAQIAVGGITAKLATDGGNTIIGNHAHVSGGSSINGYGIYTGNQSGASNEVTGNYTVGGVSDFDSGATVPSGGGSHANSAFSGKKTIGACSFVIENGLIKQVTGC